MDEKQLGEIVIARTVPGSCLGIGRVIAYSSAPTFTIERPDGTRFHWAAHLCVATDPDCPECHGVGYALPEPNGAWLHDLTAIACPRCTGH